MFWADWGISPRIERAGMDGSGRKAIAVHDEKNKIMRPLSLALDYIHEELYWADNDLGFIERCDMDGNRR